MTEKKRRREIKTHLDMAAEVSSQGRKRAQIKLSRGLVYPRSNGGEGFNLMLKTLCAAVFRIYRIKEKKRWDFHPIGHPERENKEEASPA